MQLGTPTSSVMVAEKSIVWRWWEHIRIISFICSSKYSSSILEEGAESSSVRSEGGEGPTQTMAVLRLKLALEPLLSRPYYVMAEPPGLCPSILQGTEIITACPQMSQQHISCQTITYITTVPTHLPDT